MAVTLYGPAYSTYARTARLVLEEKGQAYELVEVDLLRGATRTPEHLARNPFAQVPVLDHDGFQLYETQAIARYLDRVLPGPLLTPEDPKAEARMNQLIGIADSHAYGPMIQKLVVQRVVTPMMGGQPDEAAIADALPAVRTALAAFDRLIEGQPFAAGGALSLADLHLTPIFAYFTATPDSRELMAPHAGLQRWWESIAARPSVTRTAPKLG